MFHRELYKKAEEKKNADKKNADNKKCRQKKIPTKDSFSREKTKKQREKSKKETPFPSFSGECLPDTSNKKKYSLLNQIESEKIICHAWTKTNSSRNKKN